jgi:hypothetical protein
VTGSSEDLATIAGQIADRAREMGEQAGGSAASLAAVRAARDVADLAALSMRVSVASARAAGHTWQEIGDLLGVSRQAAFQRFGQPADPRTGQPMNAAVLPGAGPMAADLIAAWIDGRHEEVMARFDAKVTEELPEPKLAAGWAMVVATVGRYEQMGEPVVRQAADYTVVDVPLHFEAGDMKGRVAFNADGQVAGLFVLRPDDP